MKIQGKQLEDTLRSESAPFDIVYADRTVGDLNGAVRFTALNNTGAIGAYKVVYITGSQGNLPTIGLADADAASMPAFGLTTASSNNGDEVDIITFGNLKGVDTSLLSVGDILYVSTTAGEYTTSPPAGSGTKIQNIGMVVKSDQNGIIKLGGAGRSNATPNLDEGKFFIGDAANQSTLSNYQLPLSVGTSGQVLASDGTNVTFQDASGGGYTTSFVGSSDFNAVTDTFYFVNTASGTTTDVTLPDRGTDTSLEYRFKFFNHGDGTLRILELNNPGLIDPSEDGSNPGNSGASMKYFNSRCLVEVFSIVGTSHYEWVVSDQLEMGKESLSTAGQVLRYNPTNDQMTALPYTFPTTDGSADQILKTDGAGSLTFIDQPSGGGGGTMTYSAVSATTTAQANYHYSCTGTITINLPAVSATSAGDEIRIKNMGSGTITVDANSTEVIDGLETYTMSIQYEAISLISNGSTGWEIF